MPARGTSRSFRVAAAALAAAPVGFATGAPARGPPIGNARGHRRADDSRARTHRRNRRRPPADHGGADVAAETGVRIATLVFAGASFAILVYMVQDFIFDRVERAQARDAVYQDMPHYELTLWAKNPQREAFSQLQFNSETRRYVANRPGGWRCEGTGTTSQAVVLLEAMQTVDPEAHPSCDLRASWRTIGEATAMDKHGCVGNDNALFAAADDMVEATERKGVLSARGRTASNLPTGSQTRGIRMKFGIFYEHQLPRDWGPDSEHKLLKDSLTQIELADELGFDYAWGSRAPLP